ncbi:MAG: hypothetical protein ACOCRU_01155 [bacterium]
MKWANWCRSGAEILKGVILKVYPSKLQIVNKNTNRGSSQNIRLVLDDIEISNYDLTLLKT